MLSQTFKISTDRTTTQLNGVLSLPVLLSGYLEFFNGFKGCPPINNNPEVFFTNILQFIQPANPARTINYYDTVFLFDTKTIAYNPIVQINGVGRTWQSWILEGFIQPRKVHKIDLFYLPYHNDNGGNLLGKLGNLYFSKSNDQNRYVSDEIKIIDFFNENTYASYSGEQGPYIGTTSKDTISLSIPVNQILNPKDALYIEFSDDSEFYKELLVTIHYENI